MRRTVVGLAKDEADTSSKDSVRLLTDSVSQFRRFTERFMSTGNVDMKLATDPGVLGSVSEERDTEWNEEIEEVGT